MRFSNTAQYSSLLRHTGHDDGTNDCESEYGRSYFSGGCDCTRWVRDGSSESVYATCTATNVYASNGGGCGNNECIDHDAAGCSASDDYYGAGSPAADDCAGASYATATANASAANGVSASNVGRWNDYTVATATCTKCSCGRVVVTTAATGAKAAV